MRIRIVCYEDVHSWILGKFALKLKEELEKLSVECDIAKIPDPNADINHHIIYIDYNGKKNSRDTLMITHIDSLQKLNLLKNQLQEAEVGICMSRETMDKMIQAGIPKNKVFYINPAHDGKMKPRPIVIGITSKLHEDGRKKETMLIKLCEKISPQDFSFKIMGSGWDKIISKMRNLGYSVEYYDKFIYDKYIELVPTFDYYLYFGFDEGSMGFIDALSAGVKTIVTPQGYHLDVIGGITYPISGLGDVESVFEKISNERKDLMNSVSDWTWKNYAKKHLELWERIIEEKRFDDLLSESSTTETVADTNFIQEWKSTLRYMCKPLTVKMLIWKISPNFLRSIYKKYLLKKYDRKNNQ